MKIGLESLLGQEEARMGRSGAVSNFTNLYSMELINCQVNSSNGLKLKE